MKQTILGYNQEMIDQMIYQTTNIDVSNDNSYDSSFSLFSPGPIVHRLVVKKKKHRAPTNFAADAAEASGVSARTKQVSTGWFLWENHGKDMGNPQTNEALVRENHLLGSSIATFDCRSCFAKMISNDRFGAFKSAFGLLLSQVHH